LATTHTIEDSAPQNTDPSSAVDPRLFGDDKQSKPGSANLGGRHRKILSGHDIARPHILRCRPPKFAEPGLWMSRKPPAFARVGTITIPF